MPLMVIMGPMKSAKSLILIAEAEQARHTGKKVSYIKPQRDVRTATVSSRLGIEAEALSLDRLADAPDSDVYAVDEIHMFAIKDVEAMRGWLDKGCQVIVSGLNLDHAGRLMPTMARTLELGVDVLINRKAACERCGASATHTQVTDKVAYVPVNKKLPPELPDNGSYIYTAVCRRCFR